MNSKHSIIHMGVAIVRNPSDKIASSNEVNWAVVHLKETIKQKSLTVTEVEQIDDVPIDELCIVVAGQDSQQALQILQGEGVGIPSKAEAFCIVKKTGGAHTLLLAAGSDANGLLYAILELVDRIRYTADPLAELNGISQLIEQPSTPIRSINRLFSNEIEDKPWFYDKSFWEEYLTELATHRFNRFHLALGMSYDYGHDPDIRDNYFCFAYPFFIQVPGYDVKAARLSEDERKRNLEMLRFISEEAKRRGLHFQLGLWNHAYHYLDSPNENYIIEGLTAENHAEYCRDAIQTLLEACPAIDGFTFRVHYEGGIPEPAHEFWKIALKGAAHSGQPVEIDMHPKGVDDEMLQIALDTDMPVVLSPKYWAEHMGLPYHQTDIREREKPDLTKPRTGLMAITSTNRRFTRYGYADYLKEDRNYGVLHRVWPGTQRVLLWGDPEMAAGFGRYGTFCGSQGVEFCEPLTFKARKNSGSSIGREPYADESLKLSGQEWRKYLYTYRLWGRLLYNPDANPETWRRYLRSEFGDASEACEVALAQASRILPLVTVAHGLSGANNSYWPEMYYNMPIVKQDKYEGPFLDTQPPGTFGSISPFDPALFYRIDDFVDDILKGERSGKYSPNDVAGWLEELANNAELNLTEAKQRIGNQLEPTFRRLAVDVAALAGLGHFFANKLRAGVAYSLFERTGGPDMLQQALTFYRTARNGWEKIVGATKGVYREDITFGFKVHIRGNWEDRMKNIESDILAMESEYDRILEQKPSAENSTIEPIAFQATAQRRQTYLHQSPSHFQRGEQLEIDADLPDAGSEVKLKLHYRRANQEESYSIVEMSRQNNRYTATIPGSYTDSPYPIVYYFELRDESGDAWIIPGFEKHLSNQPYYVLRQQ